jgi:hypothetical protein
MFYLQYIVKYGQSEFEIVDTLNIYKHVYMIYIAFAFLSLLCIMLLESICFPFS